MSIYDKASLVQIPSGYKSGTLYSVVPNTANGDFDFTRASTATRVNKDGLIETVASGVPRLDYPLLDGVVQDCPTLLLEPQRTNKITYSEDFSEWTQVAVILTENTITSPDGATTADKIVATSVTSQHRVDFTSSNASGATTFSFFAKAGEYSSCWARVGSGNAYFDLENGLAASGTNAEASIVNFGNGWYRCIMTKANSIANEVCRINITTSYIVSGDFLGDNTSGIYLWGAQHEEGSYPTSYIPTSGSTVTRSADVCNGAGTSATFNDSEGVLYANIAALANDGTSRRLAVSDGTGNNRVEVLYGSTSNRIDFQVSAGGSFQGGGFGLTDATNFSKVAVKYKLNDLALWINGFEVAIDTSATMPSGLDTMRFEDGAGGNDFYGKTKEVIAFNEALSDTELEALTSYDSFNEMATEQLYKIE